MKAKRILAGLVMCGISEAAAGQQETCVYFEDLGANTSVDARDGVKLPKDAMYPPYLEIWPLKSLKQAFIR